LFGPSALATPANAVTGARLAATPVAALLIWRLGAAWASVAVWFVVACTDGLDGYLARRHGTTRSGAFLDPLADKVCVVAAMVALVVNRVFWWVPVGAIATRELGLVAWRVWLGHRGVSLPASPAAKLKTLTQDLAVGFAVLPWTARHGTVVSGVLWVAVGLTLFTGVQYMRDGRPSLSGSAP